MGKLRNVDIIKDWLFERGINIENEAEMILYVYNEYYIKQHLSRQKIKDLIGADVRSLFKKYNLKSRSFRDMALKYNCNEEYFHVIDSEEKAYWLGFLSADGYIQTSGRAGCSRKVGVSIAEVDVTHLEKLKKCLESDHKIGHYKVTSSGYKIGSEYCRLVITSEKMVVDLIKNGCVEHKSDILEFPTEDQVPYKFLKAYIRGYFDGDGSIAVVNKNLEKGRTTDSYKIRFIGTDNVMNKIQEYLIEENITKRKYPLTKRKEGQPVSTFEFGGNNQVYLFLEWLYGDANIYLERKYNRYLNLKYMIEKRKAA